MKAGRGDIVIVTAPGDFGKPRPALVIQSDLFENGASLVVCLITSTLLDAPVFRLIVEPSPENGLEKFSQIQIDKIITIPKEKVGKVIGHLEDDIMIKVNRQ